MVLRKREVEEDVYTLALERTRYIFDNFDHVAVSFSGGKDSTAALQVALEIAIEKNRLPLDVFFWDEEAIHPETVDYVARVASWPTVSFRWLCIPIQHRNACSTTSPYWYPWAPEDEEKWCRPLPPLAITELEGFGTAELNSKWPPPIPSTLLQMEEFVRKPVPMLNHLLFSPEQGSVAIIMGIRAQESLRRYRSVAQREYQNYIARDMYCPAITLAKPIYDWSTEDVWTGPMKFGWDYNRTYDVLRAAGVPPHSQRVCPPYGEEPLRGLWQYAICWPELWTKMVNRVPGAATAARYSRSPLYSHGHRPTEPPEGMTWQEAIQAKLKNWPEDIRAKIAKRIKDEINLHNRRTKNAPIPGNAEGGLSWSFLLMIATRGDLKHRKGIQYQDYVAGDGLREADEKATTS